MEKENKFYKLKTAKELAKTFLIILRESEKEMKKCKDSNEWYLYIPERRKK